MMNKTKSAKRQLVRLLFLLPATAVLLLAFRSKWNDQEKANPADKNVVMAGHDHNGLNYEPVMAGLNLEWNKTEEHPGLNYTMDTVPARPATAPDAPVPPVAPATIDFVEIPIPAAVVPMQPAAPAWIKLPANVQRINVTNDKVTVWLKNGTKENYDLDVPAQKDTFEKKYGRLPEPPPPPPAPSRASTSISPSVEVVEVRETRASGISRYAPGSRVEVRSLNANPLVLLDGVETTKAGLEDINPDAIKSVNVLKGKRAIARFGEKGKDGVIEVETRPIEISSDEMIITSAESAEPVKVVNAVIVNSPSIEMRNNKELVILDGKELPAERKKLTGTFNIVTISKDDAVKKYGEKGKNGVVEITTVK